MAPAAGEAERAKVGAAIERGMLDACQEIATRSQAFELPSPGASWTREDLRRHEPSWVRSEVARLTKGLEGKLHLQSMPPGDYVLGEFTQVIRRPLQCLRGGTGLDAGLRSVP